MATTEIRDTEMLQRYGNYYTDRTLQPLKCLLQLSLITSKYAYSQLSAEFC